MTTSIQVLIVGTGAVGAFYGSRLAQAEGVQVSVTARSNYAAVRDRGLALTTHSFGDYHWTPHAVYPSVAAAAESGTAFDYVVVSTKALPDVVDDADTVAPVVDAAAVGGGAGSTCVVLVQNGVGVEEPYRRRWSDLPVLSAVTVVSAAQTSPGVIKQNRWTRISVGPYVHGDGGQSQLERKSTELCGRFVKLLKEGGIADAEEHDETSLQLVRWHKLAINSSMNPSAVLTGGAGNARMAKDGELRQHLAGCMQEIFDTAPRVLGRPWPAKLAATDADKILTSTERNTSGVPSMLLDWQAGRPMELEVILGNPIRIARQKGIEMPRLQTLYALLKMAATRRVEEAQSSKSKL